MKFFAVFFALVAVSAGYNVQSSWTLVEISEALASPATSPALVPYLEQALNEIVTALWSGQQVEAISVVVPASDVTSWTLAELDAALSDPSTSPALLPYLEEALNQYVSALWNGNQLESITLVTPAGLLPAAPAPAPAVVPEVTPAAPAAPAAPVSTSSPLVQLIININQNQAQVVSPSPVEAPVEAPQPVIVVDNAQPQPIIPQPVIVVDNPQPIIPQPVIVVDNPQPIVPEPVIIQPIVLPQPIIPEPVIVAEPNPESPVVAIPNPIDVIAVAAPEVNPVDIISPVVVQPAGASEDVGPLV